jgi:phosphoserine phosphatase
MRNRAAGADSSPAVGKTTKAPAVAFFDVDGTLYQSNALRIVWYSLFHGTWRDRLIGLMAAMLSPLFVFLYFFVSVKIATLVICLPYYGVDISRVEAFYREYSAPIINEAIEALKWHLKEGHFVCTITTSPTFYFEQKLKSLGVHRVCGTKISRKDGRFGILEEVIDGAGKASLAESILTEFDLSWSDAYFYTDSHHDLPLLTKVKHPRLVRPSFVLKQFAKRHPEFQILPTADA